MEQDYNRKHQQLIRLITEIDRICRENGITYVLGYGSVLGAVRHHGFIPWDDDMDVLIPLPELYKFRKACKEKLQEDMLLIEWDKQKHYAPCFDRMTFKDIPHESLHIDIYPLCGLPQDEKKRSAFMTKCHFIYCIFHCKHKNTQRSKKENRWKIKVLKTFLVFVPDRLIRRIYRHLSVTYDYENAEHVYNLASVYVKNDFTKKRDIFDTIRVPFENIMLPIPKNFDQYLTHIYGDYMTPVKEGKQTFTTRYYH